MLLATMNHSWLKALMLPLSVYASANHDPQVTELVEWFTSREDSYFNPKQEIRHETPGDTSTLLGVFAAERIEKGELLLSVPWHTTINAGDNVEDEELVSALVCPTVRNLIRELKMGDKSEYFGYVNYLLKQSHGQLPTTWSTAGKDLLLEVLDGDELPPEDPFTWLDDWYDECNGSEEPLEEQAAMLALQRAEDDLLIPIYDMYAHRNGNYHNIKNSRIEDERFDVHATRAIEKGEQIYNSYNMCSTCEGRAKSGYGTPEIFRDYGFVEQMPQRWVFREYGTGFDLSENPDGSGEIELRWFRRRKPEGDAVKKLRSHIMRLEKLAKLEQNDKEVPPYEMDTIMRYSEALVFALKQAVLNSSTGDDVCADGEVIDGTCAQTDG